MQPITPFVREGGSGPTVVCLHSNASNANQWRGLIDRLSATHRVVAPDAYGAGRTADWSSDRTISLADEVALIAPLITGPAEPVTLVGHSYGAAVALKAAMQFPDRVAAIAVYEPTLFGLIDEAQPPPNDADGIRGAVARAAAALDREDREAAAREFIDYWMDEGAFAAMPEARRQPIVHACVNVRRWAHALTTEPTPLEAYRAILVPVLLMVGQRSTVSARGVARFLGSALPNARVVEFGGLGHMGPVTHPEVVNAEIQRFVERSFAAD